MAESLESVHSHKNRTLVLSMGVELAAFVLLFSSAFFSNSLTLWTNVLRVGMDTGACCLAFWVTRRVASANPNEFNYGLGKMENLAALFNALAMLVAFWVIGWHAIERFLKPEPLAGTGFGLAVLLVTTSTNVWLISRLWWLRKRDPSPIVNSQFLLYRNALVASLVALVSVAVGTFWGEAGGAVHYLDPAGSLVLCALMAQSMVQLFSRSLSELTDKAVEESVQLAILRELARHFQNYSQLRKIRTRRAGAQVFIEVFLEFEEKLAWGDVLARCGRLQEALREAVPRAQILVIPSGPSLDG